MSNLRTKFFIQSSFWIAAIAVGVIGVYFTKLVTELQALYEYFFHLNPLLMLVLTPLGIVLGAAVVKLAPMAGGSGVPQVLYAAMLTEAGNHDPTEQELVSFRTAIVKALSTAAGFLSGASIGAEGPLVQISTSVFAEVAKRLKRIVPQIDFRSYIAAGAGTGIAAAFNAPLGGIAFTLEEVASSQFGRLRELVLLAIIVGGLTSHALVGNELYFGNPVLAPYRSSMIGWAFFIGVIGGCLGAFFGMLVSSRRLRSLGGAWWVRALIFGVLISVLDYFFHGYTGGSNYQVTRDLFTGASVDLPVTFPLAKLIATAFSALSGLGGGILAPSLSVGAWLGVSAGKLAAFPDLKICALLGMTAYFSGAFQIPITAVIVVMEITNQHDFIFPMMISALTAFVVARILMPVSLYHLLIERTFNRTHPEAAVI